MGSAFWPKTQPSLPTSWTYSLCGIPFWKFPITFIKTLHWKYHLKFCRRFGIAPSCSKTLPSSLVLILWRHSTNHVLHQIELPCVCVYACVCVCVCVYMWSGVNCRISLSFCVVNCVAYSWLCVFYASQSELRHPLCTVSGCVCVRARVCVCTCDLGWIAVFRWVFAW